MSKGNFQKLKVGLLITTFNRPRALARVLESVAAQSWLPDSVYVCDDGSEPETGSLVRQWVGQLPICHVWQPNRNFRASRTRNLGALKSEVDYLILIDGDCLLPPRFVETHMRLAEVGRVVAGGRSLLSDAETAALLSKASPLHHAFTSWKFLILPLGIVRDLHAEHWQSVRTCNLGLFKEDLISVGGFDESYVGWGREDSDFVVRLIHSGLKVRSGRFGSCVAHLHHQENDRYALSVNDARFRNVLSEQGRVIANVSVLVD